MSDGETPAKKLCIEANALEAISKSTRQDGEPCKAILSSSTLISKSPSPESSKESDDGKVEGQAAVVSAINAELSSETSETARGQKRKREDGTSNPAAVDVDDGGNGTPDEIVSPMEEDAKVLVEEDVGILEFISDHVGFSGTIKQRYSDFIVNEIDLEGRIIHLTDLSLPSADKSDKSATAAATDSTELLTEENKLKLKNLMESKNEKDEVLIPVGSDKELRGRLHQAIKANFPDLDSNTVDQNGEKYIQVRFRARKDIQRRGTWKKSTGDYCKFVLYKENKDTLEAINVISKFLRTSTAAFSFAGTKDRRAKTSQDVTVYRVEPSRLQNLNKCLRNIVLGNYRVCKQPLKLGDLLGNHFSIVLRNVLGSDDEIQAGLTSLRDQGFINYYGMQRFGTTRVPTHHVGRALLSGQWSEAVELIMKPREGDREEISKARAVWWMTRDAEKALLELKGFQCMERKLLEGLKKHAKNDFVSALSWIPHKMRLMYIHAYQSYLWNRVVSRRIKSFGTRPVVGDLAFRDRISEESMEAEQSEPSSTTTKSNKADRPEPVEVTAENLSEFSIVDVVLPLPGYDVLYPKNEVKSWFDECLKEDGMENLNFKNRVRDYSLPGGYRKIVVKPDHVKWDITYYDDYQVPLVLGDLELMNKTELSQAMTEGKFKAVKLELSLPSSSYATMALREVLKSGTSAAYQTTLNVT